MSFVLRLKPWMLFITLLIPCLFVSSYSIAAIIFFTFYIYWIYSIGITMNSLLPISYRPSTKLFKVNCSLLMVLIIVMCVLQSTNYLPIMQESFATSIIIIIVYFYFLFSIWSFAARMLNSIHEGEIVNRSDSLQTVFYLWFFPLGVWRVQSAVQRVLAKYN